MSGSPGPLPPPPDGLAKRALPARRLDGPLYRMHTEGLAALHFGRMRLGRFDAPDGAFGVLYAAVDVHGAFAETFRTALLAGIVDARDVAAKRLVRVTLSRPLSIVDLVSSGHLARIGADARLFAGDHAVARTWSAALHAHPSAPDGILYPARHDPARAACAIFDRAKKACGVEAVGSLGSPALAPLLAALLDTYRAGLGGTLPR